MTAARLAGAAATGTALASDELTSRLAGRYLLKDPRQLALKGRRAPVTAAVLGPRREQARWAGTSGLVGRSSELDLLTRSWDEHRSGRGSVVEIVGPAGMGKSALLGAFLARCGEPEIAISADIADSVVPFGALSAPLRACLPADLAAVVAGLGPRGVFLAPVLGQDLPRTPAVDEVDIDSVAQIRATLLALLLQERPGLLVIDDAHWLDPSSLDLFARVGRPLADSGWLIVLTRRPAAAPVVPGARLLDLEPLGDAEVARLVGADQGRPLSDARLDAVVAKASGNPLYARQLAAAVVDSSGVGLPELAEQVIGARIDRLEAGVRHRLRAASVLGDPVDLELLAELVPDADHGWEAASEFVVVDEARLRFRHDQIRLAAYAGLRFSERVRLHRAVALAFERRADANPARLADHWQAARDPAQVLRWAGKAAQDAHTRAAYFDEARLRALIVENARAAGVSTRDRAALYAELARCHETNAEFEQAERALGSAMRWAAQDQRLDLRHRLARVAFRGDHLTLAVRRASMALRSAPPDTPVQAELLVLRSAVHAMAGRRRQSDRDARAADEVATRIGRDDLRGTALSQRALNADEYAEPEAAELAAEAVPLLKKAGLHRDLAVLRLNLGISLMVRGDWVRALDEFDQATDGFTRSGFVLGLVATDINRAGILLEQGHVDEAFTLFESTTRQASAAGNRRLARFASGSAHRAQAWHGDHDSAVQGLTRDITDLRGDGQDGEAADLEAYLAETLLMAGRFDEVREVCSRLLDELADRSQEVVVLTVGRLAAVASYRAGGGQASLQALRDTLAQARQRECRIEIARCLAALQELGEQLGADDRREQAEALASLGVVWMPPTTDSAHLTRSRSRDLSGQAGLQPGTGSR